MQKQPHEQADCAKKDAELDFEKSLQRLEEIADVLDSGNISLEKSLQLFEEGMDLVKTCQRILDEAEGKIQELIELNEDTMDRISLEDESFHQ